LVSLINGLGIVQPGAISCPVELFDQVDLRFYDAAGAEVAHAVERPTGCAFVRLTIGSRAGPDLSDEPSVTQELERLDVIGACSGPELVAAAMPPASGPPASDQLAFRFTSRSGSVCRVAGYPRTLLVDAHGRIMGTTLRDRSDQFPAPTALQMDVPLDPGQSAMFWASFTSCRGPRAAAARIQLPGVARSFTVAVGSARHAFAPCGDRLEVGALQPGL
jgi:hypothetical protein